MHNLAWPGGLHALFTHGPVRLPLPFRCPDRRGLPSPICSPMRSLLFACLLALPLLSAAQQPTTPAAPAPTAPAAMPRTPRAARPQPHKAATVYKAAAPEQRAEKMSQQLGKQLGLDAATVAKVKAAALMRAQKIDAIQTGTDSNKAKNTALQANAQEFKAALKGILTPAQFAAYASHGAKAATE